MYSSRSHILLQFYIFRKVQVSGTLIHYTAHFTWVSHVTLYIARKPSAYCFEFQYDRLPPTNSLFTIPIFKSVLYILKNGLWNFVDYIFESTHSHLFSYEQNILAHKISKYQEMNFVYGVQQTHFNERAFEDLKLNTYKRGKTGAQKY